MNYTVAIIDDCVNDIVKLKRLLQQYNDLDKISFDITTFNHNEYEKLISIEYDLYFLDIDMPNINGINIAEIINRNYQDSKIIFCSMREDLVFDTYSVNSFFFIRKSNIEQDVNNAYIKLSNSNKRLNNIFKCTNEIINYRDIIYLYKDNNYIVLHTKNNRIVKERVNLKAVINQFENNGFIEIYHGTLVNVRWIKRIDKNENKLILKNNQEQFISKRKIKNVCSLFHKYISED